MLEHVKIDERVVDRGDPRIGKSDGPAGNWEYHSQQR